MSPMPRPLERSPRVIDYKGIRKINSLGVLGTACAGVVLAFGMEFLGIGEYLRSPSNPKFIVDESDTQDEKNKLLRGFQGFNRKVEHIEKEIKIQSGRKIPFFTKKFLASEEAPDLGSLPSGTRVKDIVVTKSEN